MQTISTILQVLPYGTRYTDRFGADQMMPRFIAGVRAKIDFELRGPAGEGDELPPYDVQTMVNGATSFFFALDGDYDHTTTPKLLRQSGISVTYDDDGYGTIHAELPPTAQDGIIQYLRTSESIVLIGEIGGLDDNLEKIFSLPVTVQVTNPVWLPGETSSQETPSASDPDYLTAAQVRAYVVSQVAAQLEDAMEQVAKGDPGDKGDKGDPPTLAIGTVEPGTLGAEIEPATDEHGDDIPGSYILNLTIPDSASPVINLGTVTDGETPSAGIELEEDGSYTLSLTLPRGQMGTGIQPLADAWSESTAYSIYQAVRHNGAWWYSLQDGNTGHEPPATREDTAYWKLIVQDGRDGVTPVFSFNPTTASPSSDAWHEPPYLSTDKYFRLSLDGGFTWGVAMPMAMPSVPVVFQYNPSADGDWAEPTAASSSAQYSTVYGKYMRARNSVSGWGQAIYVLGLDEDNLQRDAQNLRIRFAQSVNDDWHATLQEGDAAVQIANASGTILQTYTFSLNAGETLDSVEFSPYEDPWHSPVTENDYYLRISPDGGTTFSDPILLRATNIPIGEGASADLSNYYPKSQVDTLLQTKANASHVHVPSDITGLAAAFANKQDVLPSGAAGKFLKKTASGVEWSDAPSGSASVDLSGYYPKSQVDTLLASKLSAPSGGNEGDVLAKGANGLEWLNIAGALSGNGKLPVVASEADMLDYAVGLDRAKEFGLCLYSGTGEDANYAGSLSPGHMYLVIGPDLTNGQVTSSSSSSSAGTRSGSSGGPATHTYYYETVVHRVVLPGNNAYSGNYQLVNGYVKYDANGDVAYRIIHPTSSKSDLAWANAGYWAIPADATTPYTEYVNDHFGDSPATIFCVASTHYSGDTSELTDEEYAQILSDAFASIDTTYGQNVTETASEQVVMYTGLKPPWIEQAESWADFAAALEAFFNGLEAWLSSIWCIDLTPVGLLHHRQAVYLLPSLPTASAPYAWTSVLLPSTGKLYQCRETTSNGTTTYAWQDVTPWEESPTTAVATLSGASGTVEPGKVYSLSMSADFTLSASSETDYGEAVMFVEPGSHTFSVASGITLSATMTSGKRYRLLVSWTPYGVVVEQTAEWAIPAPTTGTLTVNHTGTAPTGAQWSVDNGTTWRDFGTSATLDPDSYTVTFKAVTGYTAPSSQSVTITAGGTETVSAEYTAQAATPSADYTVSGAANSAMNGGYSLDSSHTGYGNTPVFAHGDYLMYKILDDGTDYFWVIGPATGFNKQPENSAAYLFSCYVQSNASTPPTSGWTGCTVTAN